MPAKRPGKKAKRSRTAVMGEGLLRLFAVKGVFRYERLRGLAPCRERKVWFEVRIVRVVGRDEGDALKRGHRLLAATEVAPVLAMADSVPESLKVSYLGIGRVLEFGEVGLEQEELWWEFQDARPPVEYRPPKAASAARVPRK